MELTPTATESGSRTPFELLLPQGHARSIRLIGSSLAWAHVKHGRPPGQAEEADLLVVAPSQEEATGAFFESCSNAVADVVASGGAAYLLVPRALLPRVKAQVVSMPGCETTSFVHLPDPEDVRFVVPVARRPLQFALGQATTLSRSARAVGLTIVANRFLRSRLPLARPWSGILVRPGHSNDYAWLSAYAPSPITELVVSFSWRRTSNRYVVFGFCAQGGGPQVVAKVAHGVAASEALRREAMSLRQFAESGRQKVRVPRLVGESTGDIGHMLVQSFVEGDPAAVVLRDKPSRVAPLLEELADWLCAWHKTTARTCRLDDQILGPLIGESLEEVQHVLPADYTRRVQSIIDALRGNTCKLVATHNDLTARNVLVSKSAPPGVVDWEEARSTGLPLGDLYYAAVDFVRAASGTPRWMAARECFAPDGRFTRTVARLAGRIGAELDLPAALIDLAFDACWLRHAHNEARSAVAGDDRPFLETLEWVARQRHGLVVSMA